MVRNSKGFLFVNKESQGAPIWEQGILRHSYSGSKESQGALIEESEGRTETVQPCVLRPCCRNQESHWFLFAERRGEERREAIEWAQGYGL